MSDKYIKGVIKKRKAASILILDIRLTQVKSIIRDWADTMLSSITLSGSTAKGTAIHGRADCDLFISLKSDTSETLKKIYDSLYNIFKQNGYFTRRQNVSIGIQDNGLHIDLVPAKNCVGNTNYHTLYVRKKDSWTKTNVKNHINLVTGSGRVEEILATKIWRECHELDFPSLYIELLVLRALKNKKKGDLANNFLAVLEFIRDSIETAAFTDPSNTANSISSMLTKAEKTTLKNAATNSLSKQYWSNIIW
ncbi:nucleotidyltransferase domain-containing protein [Ichthyobacterium seriolicida]|nr:nucleotidyltransferase [Ichthyobacterium seriolicida]